MDESVRATVERVSRELIEQGAQAVLLTGSHARGRATAYSDIDLFVVGEGPHEWFERRDERLLGIHWWTPQQARQRIHDPSTAFVAALGWRNAVVVDDPHGVGAALKREAEDWSWEKIDGEANVWVAAQLTGWAEYVQKLCGALAHGRELDAGAIGALLAVRLCEVLAVHRRLTSESENGLWETIADAGGPEWRAAQERSFGVAGGTGRDAADGAVEMFSLLVADAGQLLDERQRGVVEHVLAGVDGGRASAPAVA